MSPVRASDPSQPLPQPTPGEPRFAASLLQRVDSELNSEEPDMEFLRTAFQKLSHTIEGSLGASSLKSFVKKGALGRQLTNDASRLM